MKRMIATGRTVNGHTTITTAPFVPSGQYAGHALTLWNNLDVLVAMVRATNPTDAGLIKQLDKCKEACIQFSEFWETRYETNND